MSLCRRVLVPSSMHGEGEKGNENCLNTVSDIHVQWRVRRTYEDSTTPCNGPSVGNVSCWNFQSVWIGIDALKCQRNGKYLPNTMGVPMYSILEEDRGQLLSIISI